jgi:hypothetical protein
MLRAVPCRRPWLLAAFFASSLALTPACGSSSGGGFATDAGDEGEVTPSPDAETTDSGAGSDDVVVTPMDSSLPPVDSGGSEGDAATEASVCVGLGAACKDNSTCLCGEPSGCIWDNVACMGGVCTVAQSVPIDAGEACCSICQAAYDTCTPQGASCLSQWVTCNAMCGACPVVCAAGM